MPPTQAGLGSVFSCARDGLGLVPWPHPTPQRQESNCTKLGYNLDMDTLAWVIAFGIVGYFLYKSPKFRKYSAVGAGGLLALGLVIGGGMWAYSSYTENQAKSLISADQIELIDFKLFQIYGSWKISGQIKNNSPYSFEGITLKVRAYDCPTESTGPDCEIIGEDENASMYIEVPPGQIRQTDTYVSFYNMPNIKNHFLWAYDIVEIKGTK